MIHLHFLQLTKEKQHTKKIKDIGWSCYTLRYCGEMHHLISSLSNSNLGPKCVSVLKFKSASAQHHRQEGQISPMQHAI
jgi:hypothetical protein